MDKTDSRDPNFLSASPRAAWREFIDGVRQERTGWRDAEISARHRLWGAACPAADLDLVLAELHLGEPVAIVEYKHFRARPVELGSAVYTALCKLADRAGLPFLIAHYWPRVWAFRVQPVNAIARQHFEAVEDLTERNYVRRLYRMRRLVLAHELSGALGDLLPPAERRLIG